eukprot:COSAG06_NODE_12104_length_1423_cov_6.174471_2_plen_24_part_01
MMYIFVMIYQNYVYMNVWLTCSSA